MSYIYNELVQQQLQACIELLKNVLGANLLGVYLYGSYVVGGPQKYSDLDLLAVTSRTTTKEEKATLAANLMQISGIYMKDAKPPIEMTIVDKSAINPWRYPPHFDFQYGEWLRDPFQNDIIEPWDSSEMPDLALLITQVLLKSETLYGKEPKHLLPHVPYHDFIKAMLSDLPRLAAELDNDTRNVLLTYARTWSTLVTNSIRSKPAAADWVINYLPTEYQAVMQRAKSICIGTENEHWDDLSSFINPCADFMQNKINAQMSLINTDDPNVLITLAKE